MSTDDATHHDELEDHDLGLSHDLPQLVEQQRRAWGRRGLLGLMGGRRARRRWSAAAPTTATRLDDSSTSTSSPTQPARRPGRAAGRPPAGGMGGDSGVEVADGEIPEETAGPYPGDGSNGVNVLSESGIVRSDITTSASARPPAWPRASR